MIFRVSHTGGRCVPPPPKKKLLQKLRTFKNKKDRWVADFLNNFPVNT